MSAKKRLHVVRVEHCRLAFDKVEDATAMIRLVEKAKAFDYSRGPLGRFDKAPEIEYETIAETAGKPA